MLGAGGTSASESAMNETGLGRVVTHCVGRFLIDLPEEAEYVGGHYEYGFTTIERESMARATFLQEADALEKRLRETLHISGTPLLLKKAVPDENTRIFGFWLDRDARVVVKNWGYRWINGMRYLVQNSADPDRLEGSMMRQGIILASLQEMQSNVPTSKGFCIERALIIDDGTSKNEALNMRFRLKDHPDIVLDVATRRNTGEPPESLLSRKPSVFSGLGILGAALGGIRNIKEGDRKIGDHPGQEWLMKAPNDHGQKAHLFTWESPGLYRDALHPQIRFDLQSGNFDGGLAPGPISMTDKQMLGLWDQILNSLRLRPTENAYEEGGKLSHAEIP